MKLLSLFSGIGAFEKALKNQGIPYELVNYCEIDKFAAKSYSLIHGEPESKNLGDITKIDVESLPSVDLITYGFPCQDISKNGNLKGLMNEDGSQTRSGLFFNALDIIQHCKPKVAIAENVKNLLANRFSEQFQIVLNSLDEAGYNNYYKILKSTNYGVPQARERVFIVSIRKDIDTGVFEFPEPYSLTKHLIDVIEPKVNDSYFLDISLIPFVKETRSDRIIIRTNNSKGFDVAEEGDSINLENPNSTTRRGRVGHGVAQTLNCLDWQTVVLINPLRLRKLTPKEYFRLQGFDDEDVDVCIGGGIPSNHLYRQAGNSITVDVLEELFCMMFDERGNFYV